MELFFTEIRQPPPPLAFSVSGKLQSELFKGVLSVDVSPTVSGRLAQVRQIKKKIVEAAQSKLSQKKN